MDLSDSTTTLHACTCILIGPASMYRCILVKESECACCITLSCMKLNCQPICHARKSCRPYLGYRPFSSLGYFRKSCESTWRTCIDLYCVTLTYVRLRSGHMTQEKGLLDPIEPLRMLMTSQSISYGFMYMYTCWQPRAPIANACRTNRQLQLLRTSINSFTGNRAILRRRCYTKATLDLFI